MRGVRLPLSARAAATLPAAPTLNRIGASWYAQHRDLVPERTVTKLGLITIALAFAVAKPANAVDSLHGQQFAEARTDKDKKKKKEKKKKEEKKRKEKEKKKKEAEEKARRSLKAQQQSNIPPRRLPKWTLGLSGGVNYSGVAGDQTENLESITGFDLRVHAMYDLASWAAFETGIGFVTRGAQLVDKGSLDRVVTTTSRFGYVEIPAMIRLAATALRVVPFFHAGVYGGVLATSELETEIQCVVEACTMPTLGENDKRISVDADPEGAQSFDFGVKVGAGAEFALHRNVAVMAAFDYSRGLADTFDEKEAGAADNPVQVNSAVTLTAGALFRF